MKRKKVVVRVYEVYYDNKLLMIGTKRQILKKVDMAEGLSLGNYERRPYKGHYTFKRTDKVVTEYLEDVVQDLNNIRNMKQKKKEPEPDYDKTLDYLFRHLFRTGVTCLNGYDDPEKYLEDLGDMGLDVKYRIAYDRDEEGKKTGTYWVLEVKK